MADNFLLAQELLSDIKKPNRGGNMMLKLDMMKDYDRVSWIFLIQVLRRFGFSEVWIDMVWQLISNIRFSVIMNGLRQGDPISPVLFVIGAEVLSRSLNALAKHHSFRPFKVLRGCPLVTHLAYANDVVIFTSGLKASVKLVKEVVDGYCGVSGHKNLFMEASVSFDWGQDSTTTECVVFTADPFVGSGVAAEEGFCLVGKGGIGVWSIAKVYDAFPIKLWWTFRQQQSLWTEFLLAKYCKEVHPCLAEGVTSQSSMWRRLCSIQHLAEEHISWILGKGSMDFWHDNWLGTGALCHRVEIFQEHRVSDFVIEARWNLGLLNQVLEPGVVRQVMGIPPPPSQRSDRMVWALTQDGVFSIASTFSLVAQATNCSWVASQVWLKGCPLKIYFFMLRLLRSRLPMSDVLRKFGVQGPSRCHCCAEPDEEGFDHTFCTGIVARAAWSSFNDPGEVAGVSNLRHRVLRWWLRRGQNVYLKFIYRLLPMLICWELWKARNKGVFEGRSMVGTEVVRQILQGKRGCPRRLQRELEDLLRYKRYFQEITHCYREANKSADYLANLRADTEQETIFGSHRALPVRVLGEIQMEQLGFPNFRRRLLS
ncbi:uncharacterized protein LOC113782466 [Coffea eugenioides]|uniref:uncharacterized protein LOC113782466 n=1 Tax=Coffea eugenioides TaxID=49369 RepID=UPI000F60EB50|nr:uncharacterized protein LOC113782466 [Coffea eugenioides]